MIDAMDSDLVRDKTNSYQRRYMRTYRACIRAMFQALTQKEIAELSKCLLKEVEVPQTGRISERVRS